MGNMPTVRSRMSDRNTDDLSDHLARLFWIFVRLHSTGALEKSAYFERHETDIRTLQRDLKQLRNIGEHAGFRISTVKSGRYLLEKRSPRFDWLHSASVANLATLQRLAEAFGGPVKAEIEAAVGPGAPATAASFLHIRAARPLDESPIQSVFDTLKSAATTLAIVEFGYTAANRHRSNRRVEPYHVICRDGRYYLVGYDLDRRDWRQFALDTMHGPFRRAGTFSARSVPALFLADRVVGWIQGPDNETVTIRISKRIAAAVAARQWQSQQEIAHFPDGSLTISLHVQEIEEAVRWAFSFGSEATVIAPDHAVRLAAAMLRQMTTSYNVHVGRVEDELKPRRRSGSVR